SVRQMVKVLTDAQSGVLEDAIRQAEKTTSVEFVVCIKRASGNDRGIAAGVGAAVALVALSALDAWYSESLMVTLPITLLAAIAVFLICDQLDLGLKLLSARLVAKDARRAARAVFLDHGLDATSQRNAVLLFISRAERYVEVLPDRALAAAVPAERWTGIVASFREAARQKGMIQAACDAVAEIGAVCAGPFPAVAGNPDLISNKPLTE
ncbi:MAG TPA: TPM domain-containing protein, partial [Dongiaceae bacterium]|nr:TPM domain-containing protein [Dongiaceae bacterium]